MALALGVLVTYHDERELLTAGLRSLLEQPEPPDEILVYDDASRYPARDFVPREWPVRIERSERNTGPSIGRNALLGASTADFVHFHDADDWFHPEWCRRVRRALAGDEIDLLFTEVASYIDDKLAAARVIGFDRLQAGDDLVRFALLHAILPSAGTYRRRLLHRLGGYRTDLWQSEDFEFHVRLAAAGVRYQVLEESLVHMRLRENSRSRALAEVWTCRLQAIRLLFLSLPPAYHTTLAEAALFAGVTLFRLGNRAEARAAFRFAKEIGPPTFETLPGPYAPVARWLGPEVAEWIGIAYRRALPPPFRAWVRKN